MDIVVAGQRWISEMEPELGLGLVTRVESRRVHLDFGLSDCRREYSLGNAPLKRFRLGIGEKAELKDKRSIIIDQVEETDGLMYYHAGNVRVCETELSDLSCPSSPGERLLAGWFEDPGTGDLRYRLLDARHRYRSSPAFGFYGGRVELIPHQFYISGEVAARHYPRVLLADETGLGKTVEACLILHRLLLAEQVGRVLILVPESLVHQWFVELYRKFNLSFRVMDADYCRSVEAADKQANPFALDQLVLCSMDSVAASVKQQKQILSMSWDMIVVDEAHHLDETGDAYRVVATLASRTRGLLLLTATPEQPGAATHFAHLHLLDPARYHSLEIYRKESDGYAALAEKLAMIMAAHGRKKKGAATDIAGEIDDLIDRYGPGRVIFRNTRKVIQGFPRRVCHLYRLSEASGGMPDATVDPGILWLKEILIRYPEEKFLLICSSPEKALSIESELSRLIKIPCGQFNERMTLLQRDRNAAWFSRKQGARLMICSEIGSEGRNFQFAHHLIMFDLPLNPELLEQRIGRLDRIGQTETIEIHVPYTGGSRHEVLARWYHEGVGCFEENVTGLHYIHQAMGPGLACLLNRCDETGTIPALDMERLIEDTRRYSASLAADLDRGRNRLLELNSFRPEQARCLVEEIRSRDSDPELETLMTDLFSHYGIDVDPAGRHSYFLRADRAHDEALSIPGFRADGMIVTYDRNQALHREEIAFLSWDHPMVSGFTELFLGTGQGICSLAVLPGTGTVAILMETVHVLETIAPKGLYMDRFLPPTPLRSVVDHQGDDVTGEFPSSRLSGRLISGDRRWMDENPDVARLLVPRLMEKSLLLAEEQARSISRRARLAVDQTMNREISRLKALKQVNPMVRQDELDAAEAEQISLNQAIDSFRLRLDSLRLIRVG